MNVRELQKFCCSLGWIVLFAALAAAQGTDLATIRGTVTDISGGAVPKARIVITDVSTNLSVELSSDDSGNYEAANLKSGTYKLVATLNGFNTAEVQNIVLRGSSVARVDVKLSPKGVAETVTVTSEAPLIQMEQPTIAGTLTTQQILDLPRDSRDIYQFLYLNPNITFNPDDGFKFIGAQSWGANFALDGQRSTGAGFGQAIGGQPSLETIGELTVMANSFTAEYAGIANIRVTTKRGESRYHGSLFYDNKNSALAAWTVDDKNAKAAFLPTYATPEFPKPFFNFNELGGSFSGPVPKSKKTFFLGAYERRYSVRPVRFRNTQMPHQTVINGDFRLIRDANKPVVPAAVQLTGAEIAANTIEVGGTRRFVTIPQRLLSPYTTALVKNYFPVTSVDAPINSTNGRLVEYAETLPGRQTRDLYTTRLDHDFNERHRIYGTFNMALPDGTFTAVGAPWTRLGFLTQTQSNYTLSLSYTSVFSPRLINEIRGGFNNQYFYRRNNQTGRQFLTGLGFSQADLEAYTAVVGALAPDSYGQVEIQYGPYPRFPGGGRNADRKTDQLLSTFGDTLTWIKGRHTMKTGFDIVNNHVVDGFVSGRGNVRGRINYTGSDTNPLARFLLGLPPDTINFNLALREPMDVHNWENGLYFQDDFKVHPNVTLNLGVRYEYLTPFIDRNNLLVNFDPEGTSPNGRKGRFVVPDILTTTRIDPRMLTYGTVTAKEAGVGRGLVKGDKNNIAPRLGVAVRLSERTSLRGGYGFFYPTSAAQGIRDAMASSPFNQGRTKTNSVATGEPLSAWPRPFSGGRLPTLGGSPTANAVPLDLAAPRIEQYNVTFEREIARRTALRVSYLGTRMHGLIAGYDLNMIPPNDTPFGTTTGDGVTPCTPGSDCDWSPADRARLPFPELGDYMLTYGNIASGRTHALQLEANRTAGSLQFSASYTLLDQVSSGVDANSSLGGTLFNQFQPESDRGPDGFATRHRFVAFATWNMPVGHGRRFGATMPRALDLIIGGWQTSMNMFAKNGHRYTPFWTCDNCSPPYFGNVASGALDGIAAGDFGGTYRATVNGDPHRRQGDKIWDRTVFAFPSTGADFLTNAANAGRASLLGPGTWAVNLALRKNFRVTESVNLRLGATFDNLFNHPLLSPVGDDYFAHLGSFSTEVIPQRPGFRIVPSTMNPNLDFGRLRSSYSQEGIDSRRSIRLSLRLSF